MAHRCGFTKKVLTGTLQASGFVTVAARRREHPYATVAVKAPNASTRKAMKELDAGKGKKFSNINALMADLNADD